jgi:hypothetical protein
VPYSGRVGCAPRLGSVKPMAPALNIAAKVTDHFRTGNGFARMAGAYDEPPVLVVAFLAQSDADDSVECRQ